MVAKDHELTVEFGKSFLLGFLRLELSDIQTSGNTKNSEIEKEMIREINSGRVISGDLPDSPCPLFIYRRKSVVIFTTSMHAVIACNG